MKKLRVGLVGAGNIARNAHLPAYQELTELAEVVAVADMNLERAQEVAKKFNIAHAFDSVEALLANVDVDLIDVCVWNNGHVPVSIAAARAGKAVLCEKPLSSSLEAALELDRVIDERHNTLFWGSTFPTTS